MTGDVAIAISAFRSDGAVVSLLDSIFAKPHAEVGLVLVVDSLGGGAIARAIEANDWPVLYENSHANLGSAGNLAKRLMLAHDRGVEWCLCLNHDANWDPQRLQAMLDVARSESGVGAIYPVLDHTPRERPWEDGRRSFEPFVRERFATPPVGSSRREVLWSSSNGALYAIAPLRAGLRVMSELWMGYEDLAYGIALSRGGWKQLMCREAILANIFDYEGKRLLGRDLQIPAKPPWYAYYDLRNLLLIRKRYGRESVGMLSIFRKFFRSIVRILLLEDHKRERLGCLFRGGASGLAGRSGKWRRP